MTIVTDNESVPSEPPAPPSARSELSVGPPLPREIEAAPTRDRNESAFHFGLQAAAVGAAVIVTDPLTSNTSPVWLLALVATWLLAARTGLAWHATELNALGLATATLRASVVGLVAVAAVAFWPSTPGLDASRLLLTAAAVWILLVIAENAFTRLVARKRRVLILGGSADMTRDLVRVMEPPDSPYEVIGVLADEPLEIAERLRLGTLECLPEALNVRKPDIVVLALDRGRPRVFAPLLDAAEAGFRVVEAAQFFEYAFGRVPVRDLTQAWFMSVLHLYQRPYSRVSKRVFDVLLAILGLLLLLPVLPLVAIAVKSSRGPLLFKQVRVGEHGRTFTILKFRTMRWDAEQSGEAIWATKDDPRVTRTGRFLRATRIDEIPQLWNVLRGDLAIVGPRPERPEFMEFLEQWVPFWSRRHLIKPGVTGWAQVRRGYTSDASGSLDKLSYDLWYLRHRSLLVDISICLKTIGVLANGHAASEGGVAGETSHRETEASRPAPAKPGPELAEQASNPR